jgi:hypothetical protein
MAKKKKSFLTLTPGSFPKLELKLELSLELSLKVELSLGPKFFGGFNCSRFTVGRFGSVLMLRVVHMVNVLMGSGLRPMLKHFFGVIKQLSA